MSEVFIIGAGMTPLGKHLASSVKQLTAIAIDAALADAGIERNQVDAAWFCNTRQGVLEGQHNIRGQCALRAYGFEDLAIFNTDNACASSSSGLLQAYAAVKAGLYEVALVVGAEKMNYPDKRDEMFAAFKGSWDRDLAQAHLDELLALGAGMSAPEGANASTERSVFMDIYASMARFHMHKFGTTQRQIAAVAAKNHWHSQFNPMAQYRHAMTVEEVLADKLIAWPVTRSMCAPMTDGACALVVASSDAMRRSNARRAVRIAGMAATSGSSRAADEVSRHLVRTAARRAYDAAGIGPEDVCVAELHDACAVAEIIHSENCMFCDYGEGGPLVDSGETRLGGRLPINVSGGLVSKGHPIGATGAIQVHEIVTQLRGEAGARQVAGARFGLTENGGGYYGLEEAACVVTILAAP